MTGLVILLRAASGFLALVLGVHLLNTQDTEPALGDAVLVLGIFILAHLVIGQVYLALPAPARPTSANCNACGRPGPCTACHQSDLQPSPLIAGLRDFAAAFVATSGVVLGLVSAFQQRPFTTTAKVGIVALAADILIGTALVGLLLQYRETKDDVGDALIVAVFNLALWSLALGLLCVAMTFIYQS